MIANALCMSRLRGLGFSSKSVYSHAMPFDLLPSTAYGTGGSCINVFVPLTIVAQGIGVSIFRGGPPIFNE
ncbi:MAG: hypothetical protein NVSMB49_20990 [Ktedonobacteraceae bacterium]